MDEYDRAQAMKEQQQMTTESTEAKLPTKPVGTVPLLSSAAPRRTPMWAKKLSTILSTITSLTIPSHKLLTNRADHNNPSNLGCELETGDGTREKPKKVSDRVVNANPMDLSCEIANGA